MGAVQSVAPSASSGTHLGARHARPMELPTSGFSLTEWRRVSLPEGSTETLPTEEQYNLVDLVRAWGPLVGVSQTCETAAASSYGAVADSMSPLLLSTDPGLAALHTAMGDTLESVWDAAAVPHGSAGGRQRSVYAVSARPRIITSFDGGDLTCVATKSSTKSSAQRKPAGTGGGRKDASFPTEQGTLGSWSLLPADRLLLECVICVGVLHFPLYTPCHHTFCTDCILRWLQMKSVCPLCRAPVLASRMRPLSNVFPSQYTEVSAEVQGLVAKYALHQSVLVECRKCGRRNDMGTWERTCGRSRCPRPPHRLETPENAPSPTASTTVADSCSNEAHTPATQEEAAADQHLQVPQSLPSTHRSLQWSSSHDELAVWLACRPVGHVVKLYVVTHRMQNEAGAIGGLVLPSLKHVQAVLEIVETSSRGAAAAAALDSTADDGSPELMWDTARRGQTASDAQSSTEIASAIMATAEQKSSCTEYERFPVKTFLSMELFANRPGVTWAVSGAMAAIRSTAERLDVFHTSRPLPSTSAVVDFLLQTRHQQYSLLTWNCKSFVKALKETLGIIGAPSQLLNIPRPNGAAPELLKILKDIQVYGDYLVFSTEGSGATTTTAAPAVAGGISFLDRISTLLTPTINNGAREEESCWRVVSPCESRVGRVVVILYEAEDLHRQSLHSVAQISRAVSSANSLPASLTPHQVWLRHHRFPVVLLGIQVRKERIAAGQHNRKKLLEKKWHDIAWVSLEFRSDKGILWHLYGERPRGVETAAVCDLVDCATDVSLPRVTAAFEELAETPYDALHWSGWEWTECLFEKCFPSVLEASNTTWR